MTKDLIDAACAAEDLFSFAELEEFAETWRIDNVELLEHIDRWNAYLLQGAGMVAR